jgi:hypothetical protein
MMMSRKEFGRKRSWANVKILSQLSSGGTEENDKKVK